VKDIKVSYGDRSFIDLVPVKQDSGVTFATVENEPKLLQSLVKLLLTPVDLHVFGYGTDYTNFDEDEIMRVLKLYNSTTKTSNPAELVDTVDIHQISLNEYEIIVTTQKGTEISLKAGV
jgi:hypothetical protein